MTDEEAQLHWETFRMAMLSRNRTEFTWDDFFLPQVDMTALRNGMQAECGALGIDRDVSERACPWIQRHLPRRSPIRLTRIDFEKNEVEFEYLQDVSSDHSGTKISRSRAFLTLNGAHLCL